MTHSRPLLIVPYAVLAVSVCLTAMASLAPRSDRPVAAFFPPWWGAAHAFSAAAQAGGDIIRVGAFPTILVMTEGRSNPARSELIRRLREAGAWLLLDAKALAACTVTP